MSQARIAVRVDAIRAVACDVVTLALRPVEPVALPPFTAGAHIDVEICTPSGKVIRQYSLCNDPSDINCYVIGVANDAQGRGGSKAIHESVKVGDVIGIHAPRNNFALNEAEAHSVLIAGGIGITPLLSMVRRLNALKKPWSLYHCVRTPERAAFAEALFELQAQSGGLGSVTHVFDGVPQGVPLDLAAVIANAPAGSHFYCCGPSRMLDGFIAAASTVAQGHVHVEWFSKAEPAVDALEQDGFAVTLKRSSRTIQIAPDQSILDALLKEGVDVDHSCGEGLCGSCETKVLGGEPEHRDSIFAHERNPPADKMMICVSRCKGKELVLDL